MDARVPARSDCGPTPTGRAGRTSRSRRGFLVEGACRRLPGPRPRGGAADRGLLDEAGARACARSTTRQWGGSGASEVPPRGRRFCCGAACSKWRSARTTACGDGGMYDLWVGGGFHRYTRSRGSWARAAFREDVYDKRVLFPRTCRMGAQGETSYRGTSSEGHGSSPRCWSWRLEGGGFASEPRTQDTEGMSRAGRYK